MDYQLLAINERLRIMNPFLAVEVRVVIIAVGNDESRMPYAGWVKR